CDAWVEAAVAAGYPRNRDYNGPTQEGVGFFQLTARRGWRCSTAVAFLRPAEKRPNLEVVTRAQVTRIEVENGRAVAVRYRDKAGAERRIAVRAEVILSAGTIGSPQILMLSGIGDAAHLKEVGIEPVHHLPGVGRNLQDHLQARLVFKCNEPTLNDEVRSLIGKGRIGLEYMLTRRGPMAMAASLAVGFMKTRPELETPDIQFHVQPWSADSPGEGVHPFSAFTMSVCQLRPESRGEIRLKSADPMQYPAIHPNYLATPTDCDTIVAGIKVARRIAAQEPLKHRISEEFRPGPAVQDDAGLLDWARRKIGRA